MSYRPLKPRRKRTTTWMKGFFIEPRMDEAERMKVESIMEAKFRRLKRYGFKGKL